MSEKSNTPRTDNLARYDNGDTWPILEACRQLEAELSDAETEIRMLKNCNAQVNNALDNRNAELATAIRQRDEANRHYAACVATKDRVAEERDKLQEKLDEAILTMRDEFAKYAMNGIMANPRAVIVESSTSTSKSAYLIADKMMVARNKMKGKK